MMNILLAGVGGQGTVLAAKLIAQSAMNQGLNARTAETIGMAQHSPLIPQQKADLIIGFEPAEAVRCLPFLKKNGAVIASTKAIKPVTATLTGSLYSGSEMTAYLKDKAANLYLVDAEKICESLGSAKVLNVVLLGAAAGAGLLGLTLDDLEQAIRSKVPERFIELNRRALSAGAKAVRKG